MSLKNGKNSTFSAPYNQSLIVFRKTTNENTQIIIQSKNKTEEEI